VVKFLPEVVLAFLRAGLNSIENQIIPFLPNAPEEQDCTLILLLQYNSNNLHGKGKLKRG
jgi:hypothetical protein